MSNVAPPARVRLWPVLLVNAAAAAWLDFTRLHELHTSDSFIFSLASLYEWRPFFWEQDRVGMLLPLLLSWCKHPLANLLLQTGVMTFVGLTLPLAFARLVSSSPAVPAAVTLMNAAFVALAPPRFHDNLFVVCNYPTALVLGCAAVFLLDSADRGKRTARSAVAAGLLLIAHWVYLGVGVYLLPLIAVRAWMTGGAGSSGWRRWFRPAVSRTVLTAAIGSAVGVGLVWLLMEHARRTEPYIEPTNTATLPIDEWPAAAVGLIELAAHEPNMWWYAATVLALFAGGLAIGVRVSRRGVRRGLVAASPLVTAAAVELAFLSTREWVVINGYHHRYLIAVTSGVAVAVVLIGLVPWLELLPPRRLRWALPLAAGLLLTAASVRYGWPGSNVPRAVLDETAGLIAQEVLARDADAVGGDYRLTWPAAFHAGLLRHERGEHRTCWGVSIRCATWEPRWRRERPNGFRVIAVAQPGEVEAAELTDFVRSRYGDRVELRLEPGTDTHPVFHLRFK